MKICFLARPSFDRYSVAIFNNIHEKHDKNIQGFFITTNATESKYIREHVEDANIYETSSFLKENWDKFSLNALIEFEKYTVEELLPYFNHAFDEVIMPPLINGKQQLLKNIELWEFPLPFVKSKEEVMQKLYT